MTAALLDGKRIAEQIRGEIAADVAQFRQATGIQPCLATVLVGEDPASAVYVRNKKKACENAGMLGVHHGLPAATSHSQLLKDKDRTVNGTSTSSGRLSIAF